MSVDSGSPSLREIAQKHGTDKEGEHHYADRYERHLQHLRDEPIVLLEIGVGGYEDPSQGGESLRMWKEFFPNGRIIGLDLYDKSALQEDRIDIVQGSQTDEDVLRSISAEYGPFDVIVDDGSHINEHVITSFRSLFPSLKSNGIYVIEDLQTSYWSTFGGTLTGTTEGTSMHFLLQLVNGLNHEEFDIPGYEPTQLDREIESIAFYHNLVFVQRGANEEGSNVLPPHPREGRVFEPEALTEPVPGSVEDVRLAYLMSMKAALTRVPAPEVYAPFTPAPSSTKARVNRMIQGPLRRGGYELVHRVQVATETTIGPADFDDLQARITEVLEADVPGDLVAAGDRRGGATIFMRAVLRAFGVRDRLVWAAEPLVDGVKADLGRYGLFDDQVRFLEGAFRDTLPTAPIERIAVLRLDGSLYEATMDALVNLYPKLSLGGSVIIGDYHSYATSRRAVDEYRGANDIAEPMTDVGEGAVSWRKVGA